MISVAIDGPSGAGKSTLAKQLAAELGFIYVDTGAMYRSIGLYGMRKGIDIKDPAQVEGVLSEINISLAFQEGTQHIYLNNEDVSEKVRAEEAGMAASVVAQQPAVRQFLLELQRDMAEKNNILMDGRDIGTVVLPNATVKIYLTASVEARANRRYKELQEKGNPETLQIEPTVVDHVDGNNPLMQEEIFGPILPILTYQNIDEAIAFINQREKPLAFYIFSQNKAIQKKLLKHCSFGGGCINDTIIHLATSELGFGGVGNSGMGSYHGKKSFETFSHTRSIVKKATWIDLPMRYYPYNSMKEKLIKMFVK